MGLLNRLFGSSKKESVKTKKLIVKLWKDYLETLEAKEAIINNLPTLFGERKVYLQRILELLDLELVDLNKEEKGEEGLIWNLEHSEKLKRIERLDDSLNYYNQRFEYIHALLFQLYIILKSEVSIVEKLRTNSDLRKYRKLVDELKSELIVEKVILKKINDRSTFPDILTNLVNKEKTVHIFTSEEKKIYKKMKKEMEDVFSGKVTKGLLYDLAGRVNSAIEYKVHNNIKNAPKVKPDGLWAYHPFIDLEYVNSDEFLVLVKQIIKLQGIILTEEMFNVFVYLFREWYNHGRD